MAKDKSPKYKQCIGDIVVTLKTFPAVMGELECREDKSVIREVQEKIREGQVPNSGENEMRGGS